MPDVQIAMYAIGKEKSNVLPVWAAGPAVVCNVQERADRSAQIVRDRAVTCATNAMARDTAHACVAEVMGKRKTIKDAKIVKAPAAGNADCAWATAEKPAGLAMEADGFPVTAAMGKASVCAICAGEIKPSDATNARVINIILKGSDDPNSNYMFSCNHYMIKDCNDCEKH